MMEGVLFRVNVCGMTATAPKPIHICLIAWRLYKGGFLDTKGKNKVFSIFFNNPKTLYNILG